ncbi:MAG TPA: stalk domain-containing protein [Fimbriimonadaceae bacterium]|nr:stalk domain-containing protein [Fimbriimonadaceae bacterium]
MRCFCLFAALATVCLVSAQKSLVLPSLEWLTDSSSAIVRATIADVDSQASSITLKVEETLKGSPVRESVLVRPQDLAMLLKRKEAGVDAIWFLPPGNDPVDADQRTIELHAPDLPQRVLRMNLSAIEKENDLLDAIQSEVRLNPQTSDRNMRLAVNSWVSARLERRGYNDVAILPLNSQLETQARGWVNPQAWQYMREIGLTILQQFPSAENQAILDKLVLDGGPLAPIATNVLRAWNVPVPQGASPLKVAKHISSRHIRIIVDGVEASFDKVSPPRIIDGRAYARACTISKQLGAAMYSCILESGKGVSIDRGQFHIYMPVDSRTIWLDDLVRTAPEPSHFIKGEGFFPVRYIAEIFGAKVDWDPRRHAVLITIRRQPKEPTSRRLQIENGLSRT